MRLYNKGQNYTLYHGSMLDLLEVIAENTIDAVVCDPPYELNFMNKGWDNSGIAFQKETWEKCLKALKPGGYLLAFGGSRTFHRIACAIEDAGFEIRDTVMWLYGSGFPKSMNIGKSIESKLVNGSGNKKDFRRLDGTKEASGNWGISSMVYEHGARPADYCADGHERVVDVDYQTEEGKKWDGWGTALKPSFEPIIVARKPCEGGVTDNVLKYGVGGVNIDECRVENTTEDLGRNNHVKSYGGVTINESNTPALDQRGRIEGRFPANTILTYDDTDFEEVCGGFPDGKKNGSIAKQYKRNNLVYGEYGECKTFEAYDDSGSAARYFYCAKASKRDRDEGLDNMDFKIRGMSNQALAEIERGNDEFDGGSANTIGLNRVVKRRNIHPTVKPTDLMQYLVRLVTPNGGTVLDPFNGSGSTGKAVMCENKDRNKGYKYIGIELSEEYLEISKARIEFASGEEHEPESVIDGEYQISIFEMLGEEAKA